MGASMRCNFPQIKHIENGERHSKNVRKTSHFWAI